MRALLITGTVAEILLVVGVLAWYLNQVAGSLHRTAEQLADVTWGVRAVETQCARIGPGVTKINGQLATIAGALAGVAGLAEAAGAASTEVSGPHPRAGG
ncbi:MAG: hypothetical protein H0U89_06305 [Acidimicrobiia bacterium]|nr:hypothetical protein [Acidimicrobiia bacterium]